MRLIMAGLLAILFIGCASTTRTSNRPGTGGAKDRTEKRTNERPKIPIPPNATNREVVEIYILNYRDIAMEEMEVYGIPASITLAQGILESGAGRGELAKKSNNHFGIKCHTAWNGKRVYHDDDEEGECFRSYDDPDDSFRDHSLFLTRRSRYAFLFDLKQSDYKAWARGLKRAGYATDPRYPKKLIAIIERFDLKRYDRMVLRDEYVEVEPPRVEDPTYTVIRGDTLYSIARRFNLSVESIKTINQLDSNNISIGQTLYLQPKEKR